MKKNCIVCKIVTLLAGIGALNWLLVTYANMDLVNTLFGSWPLIAKVAYTLIGIAGIVLLVTLVKSCPCTKKGS